MQDFNDMLTHLEQKLSTVRVVYDLLYAKMGENADEADKEAIVHFRASEVENLLITLETFVEEQDTLIQEFIENHRKQSHLEQTIQINTTPGPLVLNVLGSMMKIRKGLPPDYIVVKEELHPLIERLGKLSEQDVGEVAAFLDYLEKGTDHLTDADGNGGNDLKLYGFMEGGTQPR